MKIRSVAVIFGLLVISAAEKGCEKEIPIWRGKIYVGNSVESGVVRRQDNEVIRVRDKKFNELICMTQKDFDCFFDSFIINCARWKKQSECGLQESE